MRTYEEIKEKCQDPEDFFGHIAEVCVPYLPFSYAKEFLKEGVEEWEHHELTKENILKDMKDYMEFAWGKVENHRGLSASRSVEKMQAWLWLLEDELYDKIENEEIEYKNYGAPILKAICEKYNFEIPNNQWINRMSIGLKCNELCDEGCV